MLTMSCCYHDSSDVGNLCAHGSGTWDCEKREDRDKGFYRRFQHLPPEMKLHVFSFCQFHVLANNQLWLRDEDPSFLPRLLDRNPHFKSRMWWARGPALYSLAPGHVRANVALMLDAEERDLLKLCQELSDLTSEECEELSVAFGKTNRYVCSYYRRCAHYDTSNASTDMPCDQECWRRIARTTGVEANEGTEPFGRRVRLGWGNPIVDTRPEELKVATRDWPRRPGIRLEPGMYHFELVDHTWESMVASCDGRSNHFLLDPSDEMHSSVGRPRGLICMSLVFRRVVHPADEVGDTFRTVRRFQGSQEIRDRYMASHTDFKKTMYITFTGPNEMGRAKRKRVADDEEDEGAEDITFFTPTGHVETGQKMRIKREEQFVYGHFLTQRTYVHVERWSRIPEGHLSPPDDDAPNCQGYEITFSPTARLFSIDRNKSGLRINFFVPAKDLTDYKRGYYVKKIMDLIYKNGRSYYAFYESYPEPDLHVHNDDYNCTNMIFYKLFL